MCPSAFLGHNDKIKTINLGCVPGIKHSKVIPYLHKPTILIPINPILRVWDFSHI